MNDSDQAVKLDNAARAAEIMQQLESMQIFSSDVVSVVNEVIEDYIVLVGDSA